MKSRGRVIKADGKKTPGTMTPVDDGSAISDDEGLGGCKYSSYLSVPKRLTYLHRWILRCRDAITSSQGSRRGSRRLEARSSSERETKRYREEAQIERVLILCLPVRSFRMTDSYIYMLVGRST